MSNMITTEEKIEKILTKDSDKYIVPLYQRPYSWQIDDMKKLIEDIYEVYNSNNNDNYYLGSIICISKDNLIFEIVDGQQRLVSLTIILSALSDLLSDKKKFEVKNRIEYENENKVDHYEPKIKIRKQDESYYSQNIIRCNRNEIFDESFLIKNSDLKGKTQSQKNLANNFNCAKKLLKEIKQETDIISFMNFILRNVSIIKITTIDTNDSFRLFNVLNSRGIPLTQSDLFKAFLFEKLNENEKDLSDFEKTWDDIENKIGIENMGSFLLAHASARESNKSIIQNTKIMNNFKGLFENKEHEYNKFPQKGLEDIYYSYIIIEDYINNLSYPNINVKKAFYAMKNSTLKGSIYKWIAPMLCMFNFFNKGFYSEKDIENFIIYYEKMYFKYLLNKNNKNSFLDTINKELIGYMNNKDSMDKILSIIKTNILKLPEINESLKKDFNTNNRINIPILKSILIRIELDNIDEAFYPDINNITIEHILPKTLNKDWLIYFTKDEHEEYVDDIGNLMLLTKSKNSSAQNTSFSKKIISYSKNNSVSVFKLTQDVILMNSWNKTNIISRSDKIISKINKFIGI